MILPELEIRDLLAGVQDDVLLDRELKVGSVHALQVKVGVRASGWVKVIEAWQHKDGGWVHRVRVTGGPRDRKPSKGRSKPFRQAAPKIMRRGRGSTSDPRYAMPAHEATPDDEARRAQAEASVPHPLSSLGVPAEPEMVPKADTDRWAKAASKRDGLLRLERIAAAAQERRRFKRERARVAERSREMGRGPAEVTELFPQTNGNGEKAA